MKRLVDEAEAILTSKSDLNEFGRLLDYTWQLKRGISHVSTDDIDLMYERAKNAGALGGKVLGAGGGSFIILYVEQEKQENVIKALEDKLYVPMKFENTGATILYFQAEDYEMRK